MDGVFSCVLRPEQRLDEKLPLRLLSAHLTARFGETIEEALRDSGLMAQGVIGVSMASILVKEGIDGATDAVDEIEIAAQRVATMKRNLLRDHLKELPHMIVQRGRGRKPKSAAERERERQEYSMKVESVYRSLRLKEGKPQSNYYHPQLHAFLNIEVEIRTWQGHSQPTKTDL